jgi:O-succinylbenzoate synthase
MVIMIIDRIRLFNFSLPFSTPVKIKDKFLNTREGYLINITDDQGNIGWGEISPLYGFSNETLESVNVEIRELKQSLDNNQIPKDILNILSPNSPSVRFGFETALLNLMASEKQLSLAGFLNPTVNLIIEINALLDGTHDEIINQTKKLFDKGFKTFKLKIGRKNPDEELKLIEQIIKIINTVGKLRLDANQKLNLTNSLTFINEIEKFNIEYLEEPFPSVDEAKELLSTHNIPIAFDESLNGLQPEDLKDYKSLNAIVLKPTMLGYTKSMAFATTAISLGITPVISSSFESPLGIYILASMSAIIDNQAPAGLETINRFDNNKFPVLDISQGYLDLQKYHNYVDQIDIDNFEEINID